MNEVLMKIVNDSPILSHSINGDLLKRHTQYLSLSKAEQISWTQIKHLYIMHPVLLHDLSDLRRFYGVTPGYYVTPNHTWVLCIPEEETTTPDYEVIQRCSNHLELLHVLNPVSDATDLSGFPNLKYLRFIVFSTHNYHTLSGISRLYQLEELIWEGIQWYDNLDFSEMPLLKRLDLITNQCDAEGIERLTQLEKLRLSGVQLTQPVDLSLLGKLNRLSLWELEDYEMLIRNLDSCTELKHLYLGNGSTGRNVDVSTLTGLKRLSFSGNNSLVQVHGLERLSKLQELNFRRTGIEEIPEGIRKLKNLMYLDFGYTHLKKLPDWLPELGLRFYRDYGRDGINLYEADIDGVDMSIFDRPQEIILQWFADHGKVPLNEVKVVFLGDGEAGKTHTIARLLANGEKPTDDSVDGKATPGIVIQNKEYTLDGKQIQVHFWDFGGQEILHSMHRMFLTERTLYVVIINARDDTQDDRARYWLHNIKNFAGSAPVLLVLNKIDQNPNASIDTPNLQKMYSGLKEVVRMSALEDSLEQFNSTFTEALLRQVRELGTLGTLWPKSWLALKNGLEKMAGNYLHGIDYEELCESCGVDQNQEELLHWFNDLGISFCYDGSDKLEDYVILKPEWLTNAIYIILFNKCPDTENGIIPLKAINRMLRAPRKGQKDEIRRVLKDVFYDPTETDYVMDVIRKFRLSYEVRKDAEFIPVLCQRESMAVADEYESDPNALEFKMEFEYLPDNVIHRLMVEMRQDLDTRNVWRTGARFAQQGTGLSAVVRSEGDVLRIFVRSESANHRPNTYLHIIKGNIDRIVADMKLTPPYCEVIYKADGITEAFDYEDLIAAQQDGCDTYRSKKLRRSIPIQNILNQSGRTAEVELDKLRAAIITACMQFQGNSKFWDATEDELNTYVRDVLRNKGYIVCDQTFQGTGSGEKRAGELDLEIRQKPDIPWTIYEALKITAKSRKITKKALTDWNSHLRKLLDNYNPSGLNYLFLVTYVDCDKEKYQDLWENISEHIRWHNAGDYERLPNAFSPISLDMHNNPNYIRAVKCTYDRAGSPTTVCHIFARMGR